MNTCIIHEADLWEMYEKALRTHDWYYQMSDDHRYWVKGTAEAARIKQLKERLMLIDRNRAEELYKKYEQLP